MLARRRTLAAITSIAAGAMLLAGPAASAASAAEAVTLPPAPNLNAAPDDLTETLGGRSGLFADLGVVDNVFNDAVDGTSKVSGDLDDGLEAVFNGLDNLKGLADLDD